jgi:4-amino-4-deoxy-L-arabinose transferase-like glycosyltransferase
MTAGASTRLWLATRTFLNPDEALHYLVAAQPTFSQTYLVSLTTAHPPLMFFLLHGWVRLGSTEFFLRLPFVFAGVLFGWMMFLWVRRVAEQPTALFALALTLLSPTLVELSAEVRQYSFLLLLCAACLYGFERGLQEKSDAWVALSACGLWLALLTHYSALIFAAGAGVYGFWRVFGSHASPRTKAVWIVGQGIGLGVSAALFTTQVAQLRQTGVPAEIAATWLSQSTFHPGADHFLTFAVTKTLRLFRYFFSHGTIGVLMLGLFLVAVVALFFRKPRIHDPRSLAVLLSLPFAIALAAARAGFYPYGGTRHDVVLALFAIPGIAIGIDLLGGRRFGLRSKMTLLLLLLMVCNIFAAPTPPVIRPKNQRSSLMSEAISLFHSQPDGSVILADYQGSLVLEYYLCGKQSWLPFGPTPRAVMSAHCANHTLLTLVGSQNSFEPEDFSPVMQQAWSSVPPSVSSLWLFQTGWIDNRQSEWTSHLHEIGCGEIHNFGENIRVSRCERPLGYGLAR